MLALRDDTLRQFRAAMTIIVKAAALWTLLAILLQPATFDLRVYPPAYPLVAESHV